MGGGRSRFLESYEDRKMLKVSVYCLYVHFMSACVREINKFLFNGICLLIDTFYDLKILFNFKISYLTAFSFAINATEKIG